METKYEPRGPGPDGNSGPPPPEVTIPEVIEREFKRVTIAAPAIHSWPATWAVTGRKAGFWAESGTQYFNITLLNTPVRIKVDPVAYYWDFGDGGTLRTTHPGKKPAKNRDPKISHIYTETGKVQVTLVTYFAAMYSINGGPWLIIQGQGRTTSGPITIQVYRFHRYLVDEDCTENPQGPDCSSRKPPSSP